MKDDSSEMVQCPLCDKDSEVYVTNFEHFPIANHEVVLDIGIDFKRGWRPCPLCKHTGKVSKSLWSTYHMCFSGERRPRWSDLTRFVSAHAPPGDR